MDARAENDNIIYRKKRVSTRVSPIIYKQMEWLVDDLGYPDVATLIHVSIKAYITQNLVKRKQDGV